MLSCNQSKYADPISRGWVSKLVSVRGHPRRVPEVVLRFFGQCREARPDGLIPRVRLRRVGVRKIRVDDVVALILFWPSCNASVYSEKTATHCCAKGSVRSDARCSAHRSTNTIFRRRGRS